MTPEDYLHWKKNSTTQEVFKYLFEERATWLQTLIDGRTLKGERTAEETGRAVGVIYGIDLIFEMRHKILEEGKNES